MKAKVLNTFLKAFAVAFSVLIIWVGISVLEVAENSRSPNNENSALNFFTITVAEKE